MLQSAAVQNVHHFDLPVTFHGTFPCLCKLLSGLYSYHHTELSSFHKLTNFHSLLSNTRLHNFSSVYSVNGAAILNIVQYYQHSDDNENQISAYERVFVVISIILFISASVPLK